MPLSLSLSLSCSGPHPPKKNIFPLIDFQETKIRPGSRHVSTMVAQRQRVRMTVIAMRGEDLQVIRHAHTTCPAQKGRYKSVSRAVGEANTRDIVQVADIAPERGGEAIPSAGIQRAAANHQIIPLPQLKSKFLFPHAVDCFSPKTRNYFKPHKGSKGSNAHAKHHNRRKKSRQETR